MFKKRYYETNEKADLIKNIVQEWVAKYSDSEFEIRKKLQALDLPTENHTNEIIGNNDWTSTVCNECGQEKLISVYFGENMYNSEDGQYFIEICTDCLNAALELTKEI